MKARNRLFHSVPLFPLAFALLLSLAACGTGPLVESGGYHVSQDWLAYDAATVRPKAAFAFSCPAEAIQLVVVGVSPQDSSAPQQIGVSGCGHRGIFVAEDGQWVLTGTVTDDAKASTASSR